MSAERYYKQTVLFVVLLLTLLGGCKQSDKLATQGVQHLEAQNDVTALQFFEKALQADENNAIALYGKGAIMIRRNITRDIGYEMLSRSLENLQRSDLRKKAYYHMAEVRYRQKEYKETIGLLAKAVSEPDHFAPVYILYSDTYLALRKNEEARKILMQGIELIPGSAELQHHTGVVLITRFNESEKALKYLQSAAELKPDIFQIQLDLAKGLWIDAQKQKSIALLKSLLEKPDFKNKKQILQNLLKLAEDDKWSPDFTA